LDKENIACEIVEDGQETTVGSFQLSGAWQGSRLIHPTMPIAQNTGYFNKWQIFHPAIFVVPPVSIDFFAATCSSALEKIPKL